MVGPLVTDPSKRVMASITLRVWDDESMTIEGPLQDPLWVLQALEHAIDTVRRQVRAGNQAQGIVLPDVGGALPDSPFVQKGGRG